MKLHTEEKNSQTGLIFKQPAFDFIYRLEMTRDELAAYDVFRHETLYGNRAAGSCEIRNPSPWRHDEYEYYNLNPTYDKAVQSARTGTAWRHTCKTRLQVNEFQSSLETGVSIMSSRLKEIMGGGRGSRTVEF